MALTKPTRPMLRPEGKIRMMASSPDGALLGWCEGRSTVCFASIESDEAELLATHELNVEVMHVQFFENHWWVGDDLEGFTVFTSHGLLEHSVPVDGGVQHAVAWGMDLAVLTGMGDVVIIDGDRTRPLSAGAGLEECAFMVAGAGRLYVATHGGQLVAFEEGRETWRRPTRGTRGERLTNIGLAGDGRLFLTREGHALVGGEEEAVEFEVWSNDVLVLRDDANRRLLTSCPFGQDAALGFDNGDVAKLGLDGTLEVMMTCKYPVSVLAATPTMIVAGSWFHLHVLGEDTMWSVEHQGMPHTVFIHAEQERIVFAGDDQNDYTAPEPIGVVDLRASLIEVDSSELTLWFEEAPNASEATPEDLYERGNDDVMEHLTDEERVMMSSDSSERIPSMSLLKAMTEPTSNEENPTRDASEEDDLLSTLADTTFVASAVDDDDLMAALIAPHTSTHPPQAEAGDDRFLTADADGSATTILDGRGTHDPLGQVSGWSWIDGRGQEIGTTNQVKVRLPVGKHVFELRVLDRDGRWTTDRVFVEVLEGSTS